MQKLETILTKNMPIKIIDRSWNEFYGWYEKTTPDGRLCMWETGEQEYMYFPLVDIHMFTAFPMEYINEKGGGGISGKKP